MSEKYDSSRLTRRNALPVNYGANEDLAGYAPVLDLPELARALVAENLAEAQRTDPHDARRAELEAREASLAAALAAVTFESEPREVAGVETELGATRRVLALVPAFERRKQTDAELRKELDRLARYVAALEKQREHIIRDELPGAERRLQEPVRMQTQYRTTSGLSSDEQIRRSNEHHERERRNFYAPAMAKKAECEARLAELDELIPKLTTVVAETRAALA